ncbi:hypothetical protein O7A70_05465 [Mesorhizobium sp. Cs1299R1N1]|uniref:hypothetical protein n=1 Tax=Mesorhizobium sp. Cs1299R1N1 TaxID=3015172 RepID=UPI00301BE6B5
MVDLSLVTALVTNLKTAIDIGKTVKEITDISQVRDKVIEMQELILSAQSSAMAAQTQLFEVLQDNAELKHKAAAVDEWAATASRYQLRDFGAGTFAYELRPDAANGEPPHRLCPTCFEQRKRSLLQFIGHTASDQDFYKCIPCAQDYFFGARQSRPAPKRTVSRSSFWEGY